MADQNLGEYTATEIAGTAALTEWQKLHAGVGDGDALSRAMTALRDALPIQLIAQADNDTVTAAPDGISRGRQLTVEQVSDHVRRFGLDPQAWDLTEICRETNAWIAELLVELAAGEDPRWSPQERAEHYAEFGALSTVDFIEQCVIEAGPDSAPWPDLQNRVDAGEFDQVLPVWAAPAWPVPTE